MYFCACLCDLCWNSNMSILILMCRAPSQSVGAAKAVSSQGLHRVVCHCLHRRSYGRILEFVHCARRSPMGPDLRDSPNVREGHHGIFNVHQVMFLFVCSRWLFAASFSGARPSCWCNAAVTSKLEKFLRTSERWQAEPIHLVLMKWHNRGLNSRTSDLKSVTLTIKQTPGNQLLCGKTRHPV